MKKNLFLFLLFSCSFFTFVNAQSELSHTTTPFDSRLLKIYSGDYLENLRDANPFLFQRLNFYLDNSWYVMELPTEKSLDSYQTIQVEDISNVNIYELERKFNLKRDWDKQTVCKIENTDKAIVLLSGKAFNEKLKAYLDASAN